MSWKKVKPQHAVNSKDGLEVYSIDREWIALKESDQIYEVYCDWTQSGFFLDKTSVRLQDKKSAVPPGKVADLMDKMALGLEHVLGKYQWQ